MNISKSLLTTSLASTLLSVDTLNKAFDHNLTMVVDYSEDAPNPRHHPDLVGKSIFVSGTKGRAARLADCNMVLDGRFSCIADVIDSYAEKNGIDRDDMLCWTVYKHEHDGITLSTTPFTGGFNSSIAGFIFESKRVMREEFGVKRISPRLNKVLESRIQAELDQLCQWANGNVYTVSVLDEDGDTIEEVQDCYNYAGTLDALALELINEVATATS